MLMHERLFLLQEIKKIKNFFLPDMTIPLYYRRTDERKLNAQDFLLNENALEAEVDEIHPFTLTIKEFICAYDVYRYQGWADHITWSMGKNRKDQGICYVFWYAV